jgi:TolA-binding protein
MKKWFGFGISLLVVLMISSCGEKLTEEQLRAKALDFENKEQWDEVIKVFEQLVKRFPESPKSDQNLYQLGGLYASNSKNFVKSIEAYNQLIEKYPDSQLVIQAQFMIGYRYANDLKDLEKAKEAYSLFLQKYPEHELAPSVQWELDHLGQDISDIELNFGKDEPAKK